MFSLVLAGVSQNIADTQPMVTRNFDTYYDTGKKLLEDDNVDNVKSKSAPMSQASIGPALRDKNARNWYRSEVKEAAKLRNRELDSLSSRERERLRRAQKMGPIQM